MTGLQTPQMLTSPIFYIHVFTIMSHCLPVSYLRQFRPWIEVLRPSDRATDPSDAHTSNFLHPCFYYYESLPMGKLSQTVPSLDRGFKA